MVRREAPELVVMPSPARTDRTAVGEMMNAVTDILAEAHASLGVVDHRAAVSSTELIAEAGRIYLVGAGRSKLMVDSFAMRLMHLGYPGYVATDVTTPAISESGDLLIACSGSGETPTVLAHARTARQVEAEVVAVTATGDSTLAQLSNTVVELTEYSGSGRRGGSVQFLGTLFEQCALLYFDAIVLALERLNYVDRTQMMRRHSNFE